jgi:hypothetical protein
MRILKISAKCSDLFSATLTNTDNPAHPLQGDYDGYVPDFMPGEHYGDYVQLEIDIDTGHILNWRKPTQAQLRQTFK